MLKGHCACGAVKYRLRKAPLFVHACHCSWCQRETGTAFALNAMIETEGLDVAGVVEQVQTPSASGKGQVILRCPACKVALYSHYAGAGRLMAFVRVGTLETPSACPPDVHIFTQSKLPWVMLDPAVPAFAEFYRRSDLWPAESLARREALLVRHGMTP